MAVSGRLDDATQAPEVPGATGDRRTHRADPALWALTFLGFAVPIAAYFWVIHHYGVNVILGDQWDDVSIIGRSYNGTLTLGSLWTLHNENRMLFPRLIVLALSRTTHLDVVVEEYVGALMLLASIGLVVYAHRRRTGSTRLLFYVPVAVLMLSLVQYGNALWGFQMCWYLVLLTLASAIVLLDRPDLTWPVLAGAVLAGLVGSYSLLQGLLIWPVGLVLLYHRRRPRAVVLTWIGSAVVATAVYFSGYHYSDPVSGSVLQYPVATLQFFLVALGDVVGVDPAPGSPDLPYLVALGAVILVLAVAVIVLYGLRRDSTGGGPIGVTLVCFGLLFAAMITKGRIGQGIAYAGQSRYRTYDLLILVGCYLAVLGKPSLRFGADRSDHLPAPAGAAEAPALERPVLVALRAFVGIVICIQVAMGIGRGLDGASNTHAAMVRDARVLANAHRVPLVLIQDVNGLWSAAKLRPLIPIAETHHLSLFGSTDRATYVREGVPPDPFPPVTYLMIPSNGSVVSGKKQTLLASAADGFGVSGVDFTISGGPYVDYRVASAYSTVYGWFNTWDTTRVPNGDYTIQSVVYGAAGNQGRSSAARVVVENPPGAG